MSDCLSFSLLYHLFLVVLGFTSAPSRVWPDSRRSFTRKSAGWDSPLMLNLYKDQDRTDWCNVSVLSASPRAAIESSKCQLRAASTVFDMQRKLGHSVFHFLLFPPLSNKSRTFWVLADCTEIIPCIYALAWEPLWMWTWWCKLASADFSDITEQEEH